MMEFVHSHLKFVTKNYNFTLKVKIIFLKVNYCNIIRVRSLFILIYLAKDRELKFLLKFYFFIMVNHIRNQI